MESANPYYSSAKVATGCNVQQCRQKAMVNGQGLELGLEYRYLRMLKIGCLYSN